MKKYIIIILVSCFALCARPDNALHYYNAGHINTRYYKSNDCLFNYTVTVGNNISIDKSEVETAISSVLKQRESPPSDLEIIIFSNSSGKEVYSYSGNEKEVIMKAQSGEIEALVKIRLNNRLQDTLFLKASGSNRKEILQKLALKLREALCN